MFRLLHIYIVVGMTANNLFTCYEFSDQIEVKLTNCFDDVCVNDSIRSQLCNICTFYVNIWTSIPRKQPFRIFRELRDLFY